MEDAAWRLDKINSFIYLLNCYAPDEENVLARRFKKDKSSLDVLYGQLAEFDRLGFDAAMEFGRLTKRIKTISNNKHLALIEIRVGKTLWRVITHVDTKKKVLVMVDAFQNHKKKTMNKAVVENESKIRKAMELLREGE